MKINNIKSFSLITFERIFIDFVISNEINDVSIIIRFIRHVYIINDLKTNFLLNNDILKSKNIMSHVDQKSSLLTTVIISMRRSSSFHELTNTSNVLFAFKSSLSYHRIQFSLFQSSFVIRNYIFNSNYIDRLNKKENVFFHIIDVNFDVVQIRNAISKSIFKKMND